MNTSSSIILYKLISKQHPAKGARRSKRKLAEYLRAVLWRCSSPGRRLRRSPLTAFVVDEIERRTGAEQVKFLDEFRRDEQWYGKVEIDQETGKRLLASND